MPLVAVTTRCARVSNINLVLTTTLCVRCLSLLCLVAHCVRVSFCCAGEECSWKVHLVALPSEDKAGELQRQLLLQQAKVRTFAMRGVECVVVAVTVMCVLLHCWLCEQRCRRVRADETVVRRTNDA
jgi:hypothetical protein